MDSPSSAPLNAIPASLLFSAFWFEGDLPTVRHQFRDAPKFPGFRLRLPPHH